MLLSGGHSWLSSEREARRDGNRGIVVAVPVLETETLRFTRLSNGGANRASVFVRAVGSVGWACEIAGKAMSLLLLESSIIIMPSEAHRTREGSCVEGGESSIQSLHKLSSRDLVGSRGISVPRFRE